jgi:hypothetical protein
MGLKSSGGGGGDPDDDGSREEDSALIGDADNDGDVVGGDCVGGGGVGVPCGGLDEVASTFGCGGFEFVRVDLLAGDVFEGMAAGEGLASLDVGFDVEGLLTCFCFMAIGPCGDDLLAVLGGAVLDGISFEGPFCLFLVFA